MNFENLINTYDNRIGATTSKKSAKKLGLPKVEKILCPKACLQIKGSMPTPGLGG